jgi:hypothetical protein
MVVVPTWISRKNKCDWVATPGELPTQALYWASHTCHLLKYTSMTKPTDYLILITLLIKDVIPEEIQGAEVLPGLPTR